MRVEGKKSVAIKSGKWYTKINIRWKMIPASYGGERVLS